MGGTERIRECLRHRLRGAEAPPTPKWEGLMSCKVGPARPSPPSSPSDGVAIIRTHSCSPATLCRTGGGAT